MAGTAIEWSRTVWNPVVGCTPCSTGCQNCYARDTHAWLARMGQPKYQSPFTEVRCLPDLLNAPTRWRKPRLIFVNSMSDLFHPAVPDEFILRLFETIRATPDHTYQVLSKRSSRMAEFARIYGWAANCWAGVSVENRATLFRINDLRCVPTSMRFLSAEPLLEGLGEIELEGIQWVVCGGESGRNARPWDDEWARELKNKCVYAGIPFFFKQRRRPNRREKKELPLLDGRTWAEIPGLCKAIN
jgi:protein gp37